MTDRFLAFVVNAVMLLVFFIAFGLAVLAISTFVTGLIALAATFHHTALATIQNLLAV